MYTGSANTPFATVAPLRVPSPPRRGEVDEQQYGQVQRLFRKHQPLSSSLSDDNAPKAQQAQAIRTLRFLNLLLQALNVNDIQKRSVAIREILRNDEHGNCSEARFMTWWVDHGFEFADEPVSLSADASRISPTSGELKPSLPSLSSLSSSSCSPSVSASSSASSASSASAIGTLAAVPETAATSHLPMHPSSPKELEKLKSTLCAMEQQEKASDSSPSPSCAASSPVKLTSKALASRNTTALGDAAAAVPSERRHSALSLSSLTDRSESRRGSMRSVASSRRSSVSYLEDFDFGDLAGASDTDEEGEDEEEEVELFRHGGGRGANKSGAWGPIGRLDTRVALEGGAGEGQSNFGKGESKDPEVYEGGGVLEDDDEGGRSRGHFYLFHETGGRAGNGIEEDQQAEEEQEEGDDDDDDDDDDEEEEAMAQFLRARQADEIRMGLSETTARLGELESGAKRWQAAADATEAAAADMSEARGALAALAEQLREMHDEYQFFSAAAIYHDHTGVDAQSSGEAGGGGGGVFNFVAGGGSENLRARVGGWLASPREKKQAEDMEGEPSGSSRGALDMLTDGLDDGLATLANIISDLDDVIIAVDATAALCDQAPGTSGARARESRGQRRQRGAERQRGECEEEREVAAFQWSDCGVRMASAEAAALRFRWVRLLSASESPSPSSPSSLKHAGGRDPLSEALVVVSDLDGLVARTFRECVQDLKSQAALLEQRGIALTEQAAPLHSRRKGDLAELEDYYRNQDHDDEELGSGGGDDHKDETFSLLSGFSTGFSSTGRLLSSAMFMGQDGVNDALGMLRGAGDSSSSSHHEARTNRRRQDDTDVRQSPDAKATFFSSLSVSPTMSLLSPTKPIAKPGVPRACHTDSQTESSPVKSVRQLLFDDLLEQETTHRRATSGQAQTKVTPKIGIKGPQPRPGRSSVGGGPRQRPVLAASSSSSSSSSSCAKKRERGGVTGGVAVSMMGRKRTGTPGATHRRPASLSEARVRRNGARQSSSYSSASSLVSSKLVSTPSAAITSPRQLRRASSTNTTPHRRRPTSMGSADVTVDKRRLVRSASSSAATAALCMKNEDLEGFVDRATTNGPRRELRPRHRRN